MIKLRVGEHNGGIASHMIDGSKRSLAGGPEIVYAARAFGFLRDTACKMPPVLHAQQMVTPKGRPVAISVMDRGFEREAKDARELKQYTRSMQCT